MSSKIGLGFLCLKCYPPPLSKASIFFFSFLVSQLRYHLTGKVLLTPATVLGAYFLMYTFVLYLKCTRKLQDWKTDKLLQICLSWPLSTVPGTESIWNPVGSHKWMEKCTLQAFITRHWPWIILFLRISTHRFLHQQVEVEIPVQKPLNACNTDGLRQMSPTGLRQLGISSSF